LIDLKKKYKFRLIVDETLSFGVLGKRGAGIADHYGIDPKEIDIITSSMANTLASGGGFCAGSKEVVDHQRLSSAGYCFSAALPSMLAVTAIEALKEIQENPSMLKKLRENIQAFRKSFSAAGYITLVSDPASPVLYLYANVPETKQEAVLDKIVKESLNEGLLLTRARHVSNQERKPIRPSIRITISSGHDTADLQKAAAAISRISRSASPEE
jgi:serine palmitoyltransferase